VLVSSFLHSSIDSILKTVTGDYNQVLMGNTDVQDALKKLDNLTKEKHLVMAARTLVVAEEIKTEVQAGALQPVPF
jgi:hypothetical protein